MKCGKCGAYISEGFSVCTSCNTLVSELEMKNMLIKENKEEEVVNMPEEKLNEELTPSENMNTNQINNNPNETIIDVASELPIIEETPAVENIAEVAPVVTTEPTPVVETVPEVTVAPIVEPTPIVETMPEVTVAPIVEPTPVVETTPTIEPTPVVEPMPEVTITPTAEPTPVVEPTNIPETTTSEVTPEVTVTTTMEETKPFVEENTVINSVSSDTVEPVINTTTPTPVDSNNQTQGEQPKKKSALPFVIIGIVAVIAIVVIVLVFMILPKNKPSYAFEKMVEGFRSGIVQKLKEQTTPVKYDVTFKPNLSYEGTGAESYNEIAKVVNKFSISSSLYSDSTAKEAYIKLDAKYNNKELAALDYIVKEQVGYIKVAPVLTKYLGMPTDDSMFESTINNEDIIAIAEALEVAYFSAIKEEYFTKTDATLKVDGSDVIVKANTLDLNENNVGPFIKAAVTSLINDAKFIKAYTQILNETNDLENSLYSLLMTAPVDETEYDGMDMTIPSTKLTEQQVKELLNQVTKQSDESFKSMALKFIIYSKGTSAVGFEINTELNDVRIILEENATVVYTSVMKDGKKTSELEESVRVKVEGEKYTISTVSEEEGLKTIVAFEVTVKENKDFKVTVPSELYTQDEASAIMMGLGEMDLMTALGSSEGGQELMSDPVVQQLMQTFAGGLMGGMGMTTTPEIETPNAESNPVEEETPVENNTVTQEPTTPDVNVENSTTTQSE